MNSYTKRGGAVRRRFCVICKKPEGVGAEINPPGCARVKGIISVSKLQGIDLFYYLLDLRELANTNDMHKSLVGALF